VLITHATPATIPMRVNIFIKTFSKMNYLKKLDFSDAILRKLFVPDTILKKQQLFSNPSQDIPINSRIKPDGRTMKIFTLMGIVAGVACVMSTRRLMTNQGKQNRDL